MGVVINDPTLALSMEEGSEPNKKDPVDGVMKSFLPVPEAPIASLDPRLNKER